MRDIDSGDGGVDGDCGGEFSIEENREDMKILVYHGDGEQRKLVGECQVTVKMGTPMGHTIPVDIRTNWDIKWEIIDNPVAAERLRKLIEDA